ncbi:DUF6631 family protein [Pseudomonas aeruginosa]
MNVIFDALALHADGDLRELIAISCGQSMDGRTLCHQMKVKLWC